MEQENAQWLPHLTQEVVADARGWNLDAYIVALEGWRRGLTLKWHAKGSGNFKDMRTWFVDSPGRLFSLSSEDKTHYFFRTRGDKVTNEAVDKGSDKEQTKIILAEKNIPTAKGQQFSSQDSDETIVAYANKVGYPLVVKPTNASFGRGVVTNINNEQELRAALVTVRLKQSYSNIIVEQHITGDDCRVYVVGDQAVAAMKRLPANVVGDGVHSIEELIQLKNAEREENPRLISCLIKIDDELIQTISKKGYTIGTVLDENEQLFLLEKSNISIGGDPISVMDELPNEVKNLAVKAIQAIPGLAHGAVDMIVDLDKPADEAGVIIELNPTSQLGGLLFPVKGQAQDVPAAIIDYYFPETKDIETNDVQFYFDFIDVLSPLESHSADTSTVSPMPMGKVYAKKYTVIGDVQQIGYHMGLRKQAFERYLNGLVLNLSDGNIEVVVAGTDPDMVDDFENGLWEDPERSEVVEVHKSEWTEPMKVGFEIKGDLKTQAEEIETLIHDIEKTEIDLKSAEKQQQKYYNSFSWKATWPLRALGYVKKVITNKR